MCTYIGTHECMCGYVFERMHKWMNDTWICAWVDVHYRRVVCALNLTSNRKLLLFSLAELSKNWKCCNQNSPTIYLLCIVWSSKSDGPYIHNQKCTVAIYSIKQQLFVPAFKHSPKRFQTRSVHPLFLQRLMYTYMSLYSPRHVHLVIWFSLLTTTMQTKKKML
jgi:hypothetical protein